MPEGIEASRDGQTVYVANWMDDTISVVDALPGGLTGQSIRVWSIVLNGFGLVEPGHRPIALSRLKAATTVS